MFRGGYYSHGKQFIEVLPVPYVTQATQTQINNLVKEAMMRVMQRMRRGHLRYAPNDFEKRPHVAFGSKQLSQVHLV